MRFDLTERFQTPIFVMTDLDLGMNNWMSDTFKYPTRKFDRGKVLTAEDLQKLGSSNGIATWTATEFLTVPFRDRPSGGVVFHARKRPQ
jgi:2-oxoglutarate ferredoxin oxidoreductase subunit alpha